MKKSTTHIALCFVVAFVVLFSCICPAFAVATEDDIEERTWVKGNGDIIVLPDLDLTTTTVAGPPAVATAALEPLEGGASPYTIIGRDNRIQVLNSNVYPNAPIVFLELHHDTETRCGTGFLLRPMLL